MLQNFYLKIFLIFLTLSSILSLNFSHNLSNNPRSLEELIEVEFASANDLFFNSDSNWQFTVQYTGTQLPTDKTYSLSVLYNGNDKILAQCESLEDLILNCYINKESQAQTDLVQLNYEVTAGATIKLTGILTATNIPIMTSLVYEDSYNLKYFSTGEKHWEFEVKIKENILPENSLVKIDLLFDSTSKAVADCIHNSLMLNCRLVKEKPSNNDFLIKISSEKFDGSIFWQNLEDAPIIPLIYYPSNYEQGYNLTFINGQWNYNIWLRNTTAALGSDSALITMNSKVDSHILFTKCFRTSKSDFTFSCTVIGENQATNDLVYTTKQTVNEANIQISTTFPNSYVEKQILRNAELSLEKAYDLEFTNNKWKFKIKVGNDENLPLGSAVKVDISNNNYNPTCTYENDHILDCTSSATSSTLIQLINENLADFQIKFNLNEDMNSNINEIKKQYNGIIKINQYKNKLLQNKSNEINSFDDEEETITESNEKEKNFDNLSLKMFYELLSTSTSEMDFSNIKRNFYYRKHDEKLLFDLNEILPYFNDEDNNGNGEITNLTKIQNAINYYYKNIHNLWEQQYENMKREEEELNI